MPFPMEALVLVRPLLLACLLASGAAAQTTPKVESTGLDHFWRLERILAAGQEPSDSAWNAFWATPGYALLEKNERRRAWITPAMRTALNPARRAEADSLARSGWLSFVIPHLRTVQAQRDTLRTLERTLASPAVLARAMERAAEFLPPHFLKAKAPEVSLAYFLDGRGYERIVLDPQHLRNMLDPTEMMGHEFHHNYRNQNARPTKPFGDDLLMWRLETTEVEGIAGLVDKRQIPKITRDEIARRYHTEAYRRYFADYQIEYARSNQWLAWTDAIYRRAAAHPDSAMALGRALDRALPDGGRIMGAWMGEVIIAQLGMPRLLETVGDPWRFWRTYDEAARKTGGAAFALSKEMLQVITELERKYAN